jgi:hypothetical protein
VKEIVRGLLQLPAAQRIVALALVVLAGTAVTLKVVDDDGPGPKPPRAVIEIRLPGGQVVQADRDRQLEVGEARVADVVTSPASPTTGPAPEVHEDLVDEQPAGAPADAAEKVLEANPEPPLEPQKPAGAQVHSCPQNLVRNRSARAPGSTVSMFVLHYTVSRPGSLAAIRGLFDSPSFGASSHLLLEPSGRCELIVPFSQKAWTQGAFNSVAESVEIMAMGSESRAWWLSQPIFTRGILASIVRDRLRARGLPLRRVDPVGCTPKAGWTDHNALECGNDHHDVMPAFPYDVLGKQIREGVVALTSADRRKCRAWKAYWKKPAAARKANRRFQEQRKRALRKRGLRCHQGKPVRL